MKQVVFNVGDALSTYIEFANTSLLIDIGKSKQFNPILDFLLPLYRRRNAKKSTVSASKYHIDQFIVSHPHNDHISAIEDFDNNFSPGLLTCPNDNEGMEYSRKINWKLVDDNGNVQILRKMLIGREPPLATADLYDEFIYYISPKSVENNSELLNESYCNNISIAVYVRSNGTKIFMPGDLQKLGMEYLLKTNMSFSNILREGVDVLIAPHHGLRSSFSTKMFDTFKNNKTQCLNIVSEKMTTPDSDRQVDTRYSTKEYCNGENNFSTSYSPVYQRKTSSGHILIDYARYARPTFEIIQDKTVLLNKFLGISS
jgi:beta-lactamase superfamily II metal-dependent hydrolase